MKEYLLIILIFLYCINNGHAQLKLKDVPCNLNNINKRDINGKQGQWYFYDKGDSIVYAMQHFMNDTLNGYFERYWYNGKVSEKGFYRNGKLDSTFIAYWENGQRRGEANYMNGLLNGIVISFNEEGKTTTQLRYILGNIDSSYQIFFVDSTIVWDNEVKDKIDTIETHYHSNWNKRYAVYINDSLSKEIVFYKDVIAIENIFERAVLKKRIVYSRKKTTRIEKIFYYRDGKLFKFELYDRKGRIIQKKN